MTDHREQSSHVAAPHMSFPRALHAETLRLRRSPLIPLHLTCALVAGVACGAYFAFAPWDTSMGTDAFVQLLGAVMPLMVGIVCGLDADAEREATDFFNLLAVTSRPTVLAARIAVLWLMGTITLALTATVYSAPLVLVGRQAVGLAAWAGAVLGLALGSAPLYLIFYALALRWGRNVTIVAGAAGLICAFFSFGGLAHGLMTGELTAANVNAFSYLPTSWTALLGSLPIEVSLAGGRAGGFAGSTDTAAHIVSVLGTSAGVCVAVSLLLSGGIAVWITRFESSRRGE